MIASFDEQLDVSSAEAGDALAKALAECRLVWAGGADLEGRERRRRAWPRWTFIDASLAFCVFCTHCDDARSAEAVNVIDAW